MTPGRREGIIRLASSIAFLMVERHGAGAADIARQNAERCAAQGDAGRAFCWKLIAVGIVAMGEQRQQRLH